MKRNYYQLLLFLVLLTGSLNAQISKEFWFVAPEISSVFSDNPVYLRLASYNDPATVTISQPANSGFTSIVINLTANDNQTVDLSPRLSQIENNPANMILNKGIYISSTANISAYYEVHSNMSNSDIFVLKGRSGMGSRFVIPAQTHWNNATIWGSGPKSRFDIVATEDNTVVQITPSKNINGHPAGVTFSISLDRGETYSGRATSSSAAGHLAGTDIISSKPISVTISDDAGKNSSYGGCADLMGDQLVPTSRLGTLYLVTRGRLSSGGSPIPEKIYITAVQNNTNIYVGGGPPIATLNNGDQYELNLNSDYVIISSSKKVYVLHVSGVGCEVATAVIGPVNDCTGLEEISFTRNNMSTSLYVNLLVPTGSHSKFELNGKKISPSSFKNANGLGTNYKLARISVSTSDVPLGSDFTITNSSEKFFAAIISGGPNGATYGYFTDFSIVKTDPIYHY